MTVAAEVVERTSRAPTKRNRSPPMVLYVIIAREKVIVGPTALVLRIVL